MVQRTSHQRAYFATYLTSQAFLRFSLTKPALGTEGTTVFMDENSFLKCSQQLMMWLEPLDQTFCFFVFVGVCLYTFLPFLLLLCISRCADFRGGKFKLVRGCEHEQLHVSHSLRPTFQRFRLCLPLRSSYDTTQGGRKGSVALSHLIKPSQDVTYSM